jgi:hypothetical protein
MSVSMPLVVKRFMILRSTKRHIITEELGLIVDVSFLLLLLDDYAE